MALRFAREGAHVILAARTVGGLEEVDDEIRKFGGEATLVPLDLRNGELIDQLGGRIYERFGRLDILVGNAAMLGTLSPAGPHRPRRVRGRLRRQHRRQLPAAARLRPAAAQIGRRPRRPWSPPAPPRRPSPTGAPTPPAKPRSSI
ncbi:MAG: SDR family NAD(P)-dependent oxidoreductase [Alphaproteobacteria bacterium]